MNNMTSKKILKYLPEIELIENPEWRRIVVKIWVEAYNSSAYKNPEDAGFHVSAPHCNLITHTRAVVLSALDLAKHTESLLNIKYDKDKLIVLCLLHDVCKVLEMELDPENTATVKKSHAGECYQHGFLSGYFALKYGLPEDMVGTIVAHTDKYSVLPASVEGICMYYADEAMADQAFVRDGAKLIMHKF